MTPTSEHSAEHVPRRTAEQVRRLTVQSRTRMHAAERLREQSRLIATQSRSRLDASRLLLDRHSPSHRV